MKLKEHVGKEDFFKVVGLGTDYRYKQTIVNLGRNQ
jgi:hypothetical protein